MIMILTKLHIPILKGVIVQEFISFDRMVTPVLIKIIYWLATIVVVILGLACFAMEDYGPVLGVLVLIFGPIAVRVYAEMSIVLFKISESLVSIRDNQNK